LTGGIGSGKSAAADCFAALGVPLVDADVVARDVVAPGEPALAEIVKHFGPEVLTADGALNRAALRQIIFTAAAEKQWLESLLHPLIRERIQRQLARAQDAGPPYVLLVSPLLFETGQDQLVDAVIVVDVDEALQLERASRRDHADRAQIRRIIDSQMARHERVARADYRLDNSGDLAALKAQVNKLHRQLLETISSRSECSTEIHTGHGGHA
jgi:dephospho-CoA kinase